MTTPGAGSKAFLETILSNPEELELTAEQIADLSTAYWNASNDPQTLEEKVSEVLDDSQFHRALRLFTKTRAFVQVESTPLETEIKSAVGRELDQRLKATNVVTAEIAADLGV